MSSAVLVMPDQGVAARERANLDLGLRAAVLAFAAQLIQRRLVGRAR